MSSDPGNGTNSCTPRCVGRALGTVTGGRARLATVEQTLALLHTDGTDPELIAALAAHGRLLVAAGHLTAARGTLREAARHAEPARRRGRRTGPVAKGHRPDGGEWAA
ncbi:hypothetical protein [Streptomyces griseofuscus]|uniref:hypothetical protein n=1 Tax=Streptomyces griseofuscus TaxID=146922 RepID=UPI0034556E3B